MSDALCFTNHTKVDCHEKENNMNLSRILSLTIVGYAAPRGFSSLAQRTNNASEGYSLKQQGAMGLITIGTFLLYKTEL